MQLKGYLEQIDLGDDPETGLPNVLVDRPADYHELEPEVKKRAWVTVKTATELLHLGPVATYDQIREGKLESKVLKKNADDRKGLTLVKIEPAMRNHSEARQKDKERVHRRLIRALRTTWWLNDQVDRFLSFVLSTELLATEAEEFGSPDEKKDAVIKRCQTYLFLADVALSSVKEKFGPEEAARLIDGHVSKFSSNYQSIKEGKNGKTNQE
jgi:hypothetical protein